MIFTKDIQNAVVTKLSTDSETNKDKVRIEAFGISVEAFVPANFLAEGSHDALRLLGRMWRPGRISIDVEIP